MPNTVPGMWGNSIKETRHNSHSYGTYALGENANNDFNKQVNASCRRQESQTAKRGKEWFMWESLKGGYLSTDMKARKERGGETNGCVRRASSHQAGI